MLFEIVLTKRRKKQYRPIENQGKFDKSPKHNAAPARGDSDRDDSGANVFAVRLSVMKGDDCWIMAIMTTQAHPNIWFQTVIY